MSKVLIIGDTHLPFVHPNYLRFLKEVAKDFKPDQVVHIGDLVDHHALSRFVADPDGLSSGDEWQKTLEELKRYVSVFPEVTWVMGNHDARPFKKAYDNQIPEKFLKTLEEIYELPHSWVVKPKAEIDGVLYTHGVSAGGQTGWQNLCLKQGQSTVIGHLHSVGGQRYHTTPTGQMFSLAVGCGVDAESYSMAYAKDIPNRPVLGCGTVTDGMSRLGAMSPAARYRATGAFFVGSTYEWGKEIPTGADCSGLISGALMGAGYNIRLTAEGLLRHLFTKVRTEYDPNLIQAVFFITKKEYKTPDGVRPKGIARHVVLLVGKDVVINANSVHNVIEYRSLRDMERIFEAENCYTLMRALDIDKAKAMDGQMYGLDEELKS